MSKGDQIGALWVKSGKYGDFYSGKIEILGRELKIVVNKSQYWVEGGNKPYFIIKLDTWEPNGQPQPRREVADARPPMETRTAPPTPPRPAAPPPAPAKQPALDDGFEDDIPF